MRSLPFVLLTALAPLAAAGAQGWIIPRPCVPPQPVACIPERPCPRPRPCGPTVNPASAVVRTASDVRVELADRVLRYEVRETFVNRGGALGEADYLFPLPKNAAFQDLRMTINGELVAGETMNADEARRVYEEIVRRQRDPALVEWMGHGLLRTRIFPIAPGEEKQVIVRFQSVAEREGDALRVDYFRGARPGQGEMPNGRDDGVASSFTLTYAGEQYGSPYSPTHAIEVSDAASGRDRRTVRVRGDARDLALLLPLRRSDRPSVSVLTYAPGSESDAGGFALITVSPPSRPRGARSEVPRDVTFVVDVSGSMSGRKIEQARAAGRQLLATLEPGDRFRIIDFSTDVRSFRDGFVPATRENLAAAARYVDDLQAEGSTNISGALDAALRTPAGARGGDDWSAADSARGSASRLPIVLFLTDGEPTVGERDPARIAQRAADRRGRARVFTFGLGSDVHAGLLEQLAVEGRGTAHFVRPDESVERAVSLVASRLTSPVLTDVRVRAEGAGVRLVKMHPAEPADVFAGQDLVVLARYTGSGPARVRVEARTPSGPVDWTADADFPERERGNAFVARLWATQRVGWLSAERRRQGGSPELDGEIRTLGERYGIPTEFTSYFVREPGMVADAARLQRGTVGSVMGGAGASRRVRTEAAVANAAPPPAVAAAPTASVRDQAFEQAKVAAEQRQATSLAAVDSAAQASAGVSGAQRRVGNRIFSLSDRGVWTDARARADVRTVRVKAYSDAYFKLIDRVADLRAAFALGDRVLVAGAKVMVEVAPDAGVETLSEKELADIGRAW